MHRRLKHQLGDLSVTSRSVIVSDRGWESEVTGDCFDEPRIYRVNTGDGRFHIG